MSDKEQIASGFNRETLIEAIKLGAGSFDKRGIARALGLKTGEQKHLLKQALGALEAEGVIRRDDQRNYSLAGELPAVCVVEITGRDIDGELLAQPARSEGKVPLIRLAPGQGAGGRGEAALGVGDKALVRLAADDEGGYEARLIRKLGHSVQKILCVLRKPAKGPYRLVPVDRRSRHELVPAKGESDKANDGDLVVCELARERRNGLKTATILEVLGDVDSPGAGSVIALHSHGVPTGFADKEMREAETVKAARMQGREDLRDLPLLTIDPEDAKDHDDAVWAAADTDPKNEGGWIVMVAIADVAAYVTPGSELDRGAFKRGNSVYLPDRVVPMLPERLSNDLCSLREGEERPCLAVRMVFDRFGQKKSHKFLRGWMKSAAKLSYNDAQAAIDGTGNAKANALLDTVLRPLWSAYAALCVARAKREPLEIDSPERRVRVGADGKVTGIELRERFDAHRLIEECMIQANVCAAETLEERRVPLIYRVHEEPSREKIDALADYLPNVGLKWTRGDKIAPIRRYADLTVHRALIRALNLGDDGQSDEERSRLTSIAEEITQLERRAMAAERDAVDRFVALYLADHVGGEFPGRITGVTRFGAFVRLAATGADGLVPISRLGEERFVHDDRAHALIGEQTGGRYRLGMSVTVRIEEATPITGGLLLDMVTEAEPGPRPKRGTGRSAPAGGRTGGRPWKKGKRR